jgi:hypothetical protein
MKFYKFQYSEKDEKGDVTVKHGYFATIEVFEYWLNRWNVIGVQSDHSYFIDYEDGKYNNMHVNADCDPVDHPPIGEHRIGYCDSNPNGLVVIRGF